MVQTCHDGSYLCGGEGEVRDIPRLGCQLLPKGETAHTWPFRRLRVDLGVQRRLGAAAYLQIPGGEEGVRPARPSAPFLVREVPPAPPWGPAAFSLRPRSSGLRATPARRRRARCPPLLVARLRRPREMAPSPLSVGPPGRAPRCRGSGCARGRRGGGSLATEQLGGQGCGDRPGVR